MTRPRRRDLVDMGVERDQPVELRFVLQPGEGDGDGGVAIGFQCGRQRVVPPSSVTRAGHQHERGHRETTLGISRVPELTRIREILPCSTRRQSAVVVGARPRWCPERTT